MAITDLTNTTWYCSGYWGLPTTTNYYISGKLTYNNTDYNLPEQTLVRIRSDEIHFSHSSWDNNILVDYGSECVLYISTIDNNDAFYNFLTSVFSGTGQPNFIQLKVTDLTDTTWNVPAGWEAVSGYGKFSMGSYYVDNVLYTELYIGYLDAYNTPARGYITFFNAGDDAERTVSSSDSFTINLPYSGTSSNDPKLIAWLSKWGELQGGEEEPEEPEVTPTRKFTRLYLGIPVVTSGSRRFRKLQTTEWDGLISFTILADEDTVLSFQAKDGMKWSEWILTDYNSQTVVALADGTLVLDGTDVRINAALDDVIINGYAYTVTVPSLTSPTIELSETTLNIYDEEGLATSYDILVDGEVKATVDKVSTVSITLKAQGGYMSDTGSTTYIKFGAAPTSSDDWDYYTPDGEGYLVAKTATDLDDITIDVIPTAYIWCNNNDGYAGYSINDGSETNDYTSVGVGYTNATNVTLSDGDNLWLRSAYLD